jgi:multiple sugar transport system substrate-binding protein
MKKFSVIVLALVVVISMSVMASAKDEVSVFWAEYDGLTPEYAQNLEAAFEEAYPEIDLKIISIPWDSLHDKLITTLGGGQAPELSVIGTRWLLEFMDMDVVEPIEQHLSEDLLATIPESIMEGKLKGVLYGLPVAIGPRIMFYRTDLIDAPPETYEEMLEIALEIDSDEVYGVGMVGKKHTELTDFAYYFYGNGGDFFATAEDGSYGKCTVNSPEGVEALTFMNDLVNKYEVTQPSTLADTRHETQDLFLAGKLGMIQIGGFAASLLKQRDVDFGWAPALIPHFEGKPRAPLFITDTIVMFKDAKNKDGAAKFLEFFYQDEWRLEFDKLTGFPPVKKTLADDPHFQDPTYQVMVKSMDGAKAWPLIAEWPECSDIIWNAVSSVFLGAKDPQTALDDAAAEIDALRGM